MTTIPVLDDFDIYHTGLSGGKDSTALALWAYYESGLPREKMCFEMCDTGNEDAFTYGMIDILREHFPITLIKPERDFYELARHKKRFPSRKAQFCTVELKIMPTRERILELQRQGYDVVRFSGVRRAEGHNSNDRGSAATWEWHDGDMHWVHRPIVDKDLAWVWDMHRKYLSLDRVCAMVNNDPTMPDDRKAQIVDRLQTEGIPCNPLYVMGATRVGCYPCINSRKAELRALVKFRPERVQFIAEKELWVGQGLRNNISTFFQANVVPPRWRSTPITTEDERTMNVATIRDVTEWAQTARGGRQYDMDFEDDDLPRASLCDIGGLCE
jgi:3'-phosphoadenosine 5'-phosphosulfate sulfotransferase (PAPS reductase)/FAD synthetase